MEPVSGEAALQRRAAGLVERTAPGSDLRRAVRHYDGAIILSQPHFSSDGDSQGCDCVLHPDRVARRRRWSKGDRVPLLSAPRRAAAAADLAVAGLDTTPLDRLVDELLYENTAGFTRILVDQSEIRARIRTERDTFLDTALAIGLRSMFLAFLLSGLLVGAIRRIIAGAGRVQRGDLDVRFDYSGRDELGQLTDSLNNMVVGLKQREEMRGELQAAEEIQKRLVADRLPEGMKDSLSFGTFYKAMSGVGGDYYDFIETPSAPGRFVFCVADVSNHGVGPAIVMTLMRSQLHSIVRRGEIDPMRIVLELNERTYADTPENIFITLFLGVYDAKDSSIRYVSAGHNPAYIYRYRTEQLETVPAGGMPIGAVDNDLFASIIEVQTAKLGPGDLFFQYTDGVNEAMTDDDVLFGIERMEAVLRTLGKKRPDVIVQTLAQAVERFTGKQIFCDGPSELNDDIAMIAFRRLK